MCQNGRLHFISRMRIRTLARKQSCLRHQMLHGLSNAYLAFLRSAPSSPECCDVLICHRSSFPDSLLAPFRNSQEFIWDLTHRISKVPENSGPQKLPEWAPPFHLPDADSRVRAQTKLSTSPEVARTFQCISWLPAHCALLLRMLRCLDLSQKFIS